MSRAIVVVGAVVGAFVCIFVGGCAQVQARIAVEREWPTALSEIDVAQLPPKDDRPARVLIDDVVVRFDEEDGVVVARVIERSRVRVHTPAGNNHIERGVTYDRSFETVELLEARVTAADGTSRMFGLKEEDVVEVPWLGAYMLYQSSRSRSLVFAPPAPGGVVETVSVQRTVRPELFAFSQVFNLDGVVGDVVRLVVDAPAGWDIESLATKGGAVADFAPIVDEKGGRRRLTWDRRATAPVPDDEWAAPWGERTEVVSVRLRRAVLKDGSEVTGPKDAADLSRVLATMQQASVEDTPALRKVVTEVLGPTPTSLPKAERAAKLYAWTRDSIRYCAIEIGLGGWVPHAAGDVEGFRYGDCKDKANLLKSLLKIAEVDSRLVAIHSGARRNFRLPVVGANFNHAILVVDLDDGPVFVDPTTRTVAFADLPTSDEERFCLPVQPSGSDLVLTPSSSADTDRRVARYDLRFDGNELRGDYDLVVAGAWADRLRDDLLESPIDERGKTVVRALSLRGARSKVVTTENEAPPLYPTPLHAKGKLERDIGNGVSAVSASQLLADELPQLSPRRSPVDVELWHRGTIDDEVRLRVPKGLRVRRLPPAASSSSPTLEWSIAWSEEDGAVVLRHRLITKALRVAAADVAAFAKELDGYRRASTSNVLFEPVSAEAPQ